MLDAAALIARERAEVQFAVVVAPSRTAAEVTDIINARRSSVSLPTELRLITHTESREALAASDAAAVASGTATLEAAILNTPLVVVYMESKLNWYALRPLINTEHFGLVNLIAGERLAPELLQNDFTGERLASELLSLLQPARNSAVRARLREVTERLGAGGTSRRAAETVLRALRGWTTASEVPDSARMLL
jgi:lipid-A-disaccharide synthase